MNRILLLVPLLLCLNSFAQTPSYETIVSYVHDNVKINPNSGMFTISRKPEGYFICTDIYTNPTKGENEMDVSTYDCQKIWDAKTNEFSKLIYQNQDRYLLNDESEISQRFPQAWNQRQHIAAMIYFGYNGWIEDTKQLIESKLSPTNKELETLARAYFAEANAYIHPNQYGLEGSQKGKYPNARYEKLSMERVQGFKKFYDKSLEIWERIRKNDPNYSPNLILDIDLKIGNEYMHGFLTMNAIQEPDLAKEYLNKANYPNSFIEYAKTTLDECSNNAILLTNGDSDTYPLWYVQEKLGYRKDVIVLNLSLSQTDWYRAMLLDKNLLKSNFSSQQFDELSLHYFAFDGQDPISFSDWVIKFQTTESNNLESLLPEYYTLVNGKWNLNYGNGAISVRDLRYCVVYQLFIFDIINSNPKRSIYTTSFYGGYDLGLQDYLAYNGQLFRLKETLQESIGNSDFDKRIITILKNLSSDYFKGLGKWGELRKDILLTTCLYVSFDVGKQLVPIVEEKIINDLSLGSIKPSFAEDISKFYETFESAKQQTFRSSYDSYALKYVRNFQLNPGTLYDDLNEIEQIILIYRNSSSSDMLTSNNQPVKWFGSKNLRLEILTKLNELKSYCRVNGMHQSFQKITSLLTKLEH